ncbi:hypothetical protein EMPS_04907 [Entomortierella parvispora]|uniref:Uncharacterized protein n=1 Tax=Entomortierella parvispora TaxID=205924 RepID=A0A9P3LW05_9FUNG|nr:hypothetical protein EMPS_04907 [Entomortierella parvispora]
MTTTVETATPTRGGLAPGELSPSSNSALPGTPTPATVLSAHSRIQRTRSDRGYGRVKGGSIWFTRVSVYGMLAFIALFSADVEHLFMYHYDSLSPPPPRTNPAFSKPHSSLYTTTSTHRSLTVLAYDSGHHRSGHEQEYIQEHGYYSNDARQRRKWSARLQRTRSSLKQDQEARPEGESERSRRQRRGLGLMPSIFCHAIPSLDVMDDIARMFGGEEPKTAPEKVVKVEIDPRVEKMLRLRRALPGFNTASDHDMSKNDKDEDEQGFAYLGESENIQQRQEEDAFVKRRYSQGVLSAGDYCLYGQKARHVFGSDLEDALIPNHTMF